jgi:hypothetical protein
MFELTQNQIQLIEERVVSAGVNYSHLQYDLIDHICCDVETRMQKGQDFSSAYAEVSQAIGIKGLKRIQEDTLMLIDKNYRMMKKSMKIIGFLALALMSVSALFKIFHLPGAGILLVLSFIATVFLFYPSALYVMYKEVNQKKQAFLYVAAFLFGAAFMLGVLFKVMHFPYSGELFLIGLAGIILVLLPMNMLTVVKRSKQMAWVNLFGLGGLLILTAGLLFKIQHWPGAAMLLFLGAFLLVVVYVPTFYLKLVKKATEIRVDFIFMLVALSYFIIFTFLFSLNQTKGVAIDQRQQLEQIESQVITVEQLIAKSTNHSDLVGITNAANQACASIDGLKNEIISFEFKNNSVQNVKQFKDLFAHSGYFNQPVAKENLTKLNSSLSGFTALLNEVSIEQAMIELVDYERSFGDGGFQQLPVVTVLIKLSRMEYNIRLCQFSAINKVNPNITSHE